jgi:RimK family alpha-L-glutamate ligase
VRLALLSGGTGWHVQDLLRAAHAEGHAAEAIDFRTLTGRVPAERPTFDAAIVRTMPSGSLEQVVFRMDRLHDWQAAGVTVVNSPRSVEVCVDKYLTSATLARAGLPTPRTIACQKSDDAMSALADLGGDVVIKPLFGAEGRGIVRVSDVDLAWRTFRAIEQTGGVLYLQEFVPHPGWDARAFVLNGEVIAAMRRDSADWRTNVARGASVTALSLDAGGEHLAIAAAEAVGAQVAGVDLLPMPGGGWTVLEVNGVPGWRALAAACEIDVAREIVKFVAAEAGK